MASLNCLTLFIFLTLGLCVVVFALKEENVCLIGNVSKEEIFKRKLDAIFAGNASKKQEADKQVFFAVLLHAFSGSIHPCPIL